MMNDSIFCLNLRKCLTLKLLQFRLNIASTSLYYKKQALEKHYKNIVNQIDVQNVVRLCQKNSKMYWTEKII